MSKDLKKMEPRIYFITGQFLKFSMSLKWDQGANMHSSSHNSLNKIASKASPPKQPPQHVIHKNFVARLNQSFDRKIQN